MTRWALGILAIVALGGVLLYFQGSGQPTAIYATTEAGSSSPATDVPRLRQARTAPEPEGASPAEHSDPTGSTEAAAAPAPRRPLAPLAAPPVLDTAESSSLPPLTILENMRTSVRQYGSAFAGNPVGNNAEITAALQGDNPKQVNFLKQDGNRVNSNGELVDAWGTPYFFHQISAQETEIRSAGPDRVMYTTDDLVTR